MRFAAISLVVHKLPARGELAVELSNGAATKTWLSGLVCVEYLLDGPPLDEHFAEKIHNNMAAWTARMYGPPESNSMGFDHWRTMADARIANPANPRWLAMVWWEHDYLIWSLHHLTDLGLPLRAKK